MSPHRPASTEHVVCYDCWTVYRQVETPPQVETSADAHCCGCGQPVGEGLGALLVCPPRQLGSCPRAQWARSESMVELQRREQERLLREDEAARRKQQQGMVSRAG